MTHATLHPLASVRRAIASALLAGDTDIPERLGTITLRPAQRHAAGRLASLVRVHGGAMLAEPVGLGKTYTALAAARVFNERILIAVPAALVDMWASAMHDAAIDAAIVTHEALSRGVAPAQPAGIIVVDEAHRLRSPDTKRYAMLAALGRRSRILLVTATPVQNRREDLVAQLGLFLGRRTRSFSDAELAAFVVRESSSAPDGQPRLDGPHEVRLAISDDDCLKAIVSLPPPAPAKDESVAVALMTYGLVHQWTSSRAALVASLERRRGRAVALRSVLDTGRNPTRAELSAWTQSGDAVQLAFPELVVAVGEPADVPLDELSRALDRHDAALSRLLRQLRSGDDPDAERAAALRRIRNRHPGERIIAFCHYTETVNALRSHLARDAGVAALTAHGARVAGGRIDRDEVLAQFTPRPPGMRAPSPAEHISLLITTDLLSEGLNLQEASVIVHLDLPWNPARLEQRVGRARRLGSQHEVVTVYAIAPPAAAERLLRIAARLRAKLAIADAAIGTTAPLLPWIANGRGDEIASTGSADALGAAHRELRSWIAGFPAGASPDDPTIAAVKADVAGYLALVRGGDRLRLIADIGDGCSAHPRSLYRAILACGGDDDEPCSARLSAANRDVRQWLEAERGACAVDVNEAGVAPSRRAALARVSRATARVPRHRRMLVAPLAVAARSVLGATMSEGDERILDSLVSSSLPDEAWLAALAEFASGVAAPAVAPGGSTIVALILLQRPAP